MKDREVLDWEGLALILYFHLNELIPGNITEGKSTFAFFLTLRKPMTQYGGMGCGTKCGKLVSKVSCGVWLGIYMQTIEAVSF